MHTSGVDFCVNFNFNFCSISVTMMSRIMLNLHETAEKGIWSTQRTSSMDRSGCRRDSQEMQENGVELDTFMTGSGSTSRCDIPGSISQIVSGLERIEEEEGCAGTESNSVRVSSRMSGSG